MKKIVKSLFAVALMTILSFNLCYAAPYSGAMPANAINPLNHYAYTSSNTWFSFDGLNLGIRISSNSQLIDTGYDVGGVGSNYSLDINQWLAGQFTLRQTSTIDSIQGYMWGQSNGELRLAIYNSDNVNNIPTGSPIFTQTFNTSDVDGWYGLTGINLPLDAGTYWAAFEVAPSQVVPIPGAFLLFGSGLLGLLGIQLRRTKE
ncbi:MAG: hypothetical protein HGB14_03820 [Anaerolineaceae bacterium]|nr:hypothetical protein [Anaerolineaceae bacterium]